MKKQTGPHRIVVPKFAPESRGSGLARKQAEKKGLPYQTYIKCKAG